MHEKFEHEECKSSNHRKEIDRFRKITNDIELIDTALESNDEKYVKKIHMQIDGKYQACIKGWELGMYAFHLEHGFVYDSLDIESMKDNLMLMRPKLEAFKEQWNVAYEKTKENNNNVSVVVNNSIDVNVSFEQTRKIIEDMPGLTEKDTVEIIRRIDELETILNENINKKSKWERIKPILLYVIDKGIDVATPVMQLILQKIMGF